MFSQSSQRQDPNDISLTNVPRDHPLIPFANLEAEAQGLLDRLLDILHGDHRLDARNWRLGIALTECSDALLVTATLNSLGVLVQRRPSVSNRILSSVLNFNPLKLANSPMTSRTKVLLRSLERTTRVLLYNVMKRYVASAGPQCFEPNTRRNPENNINGRIQQYLERMHRMRLDVFEESNRKRPAPVEPNDGLDAAKRQRLGATVPPSTTPPVPPLPPGPVSYRQLYTLNPDASTANFDVQVFQDKEQLIRILIPVLQSINEAKLTQAVNVG
jgi:symplekin